VCRCLGVAGQFDPIIEVVPDTGHVYAVWMNNFNVMFSRSTDHGRTWSRHVSTTRPIAWADKPTLAASADGKDVYVSWNGPTGGDPWIAESNNFGHTWSRTKLVVGDRYFFAYDAAVLPNGTVIFSESSLSYSGPDGAARGTVRHHAFISRNGGLTWSNQVIDEVRLGEDCVSAGCYDDFYAGQTAVSADENGDLVYAYTGADRHEGKQRIYVKTSSDDGQTWSARTRLSPQREMATGPAVEGTGEGDFRLWFMRTTGGNHNRWNVWYRRSTDGGTTWSPAVKISDADSGARYKSPRGFLDVYGDYGEIAITSEGKTIGAWGEGFSWIGPGGAWINREL
jgi:Neuraminidase (sialidase)